MMMKAMICHLKKISLVAQTLTMTDMFLLKIL